MLDPNQQQQQQQQISSLNMKASSFSVTDENRHYLKLFIQTYHNLPILWDTTLRDYTNRDKRAEAYQQLVPIYKYLKRDANLQDVKKKINTLRTNYRKELKIIESARRQGNSYQPRCWTFYELDFLRNAEKFLAVDPNYIKSETPNSPSTTSSSAFGLFNEATHQGNFLEISPYGFRMNNGTSPPPNIAQMFQKSFGAQNNNITAPQSKPSEVTSNNTAHLNPLSDAALASNNLGTNNLSNYGQQIQQQQLSHNSQLTQSNEGQNKRLKTSGDATNSACTCLSSKYPEEESLTRTWAYKLKRLPRDQRLFAEKFINDILFEAESGTLHRGSMQINAFEPYVRFDDSQADDNTSNSTIHDKSQSPQVVNNNSPNTTGAAMPIQPPGHSTNSQSRDMMDIKSGIDLHDNSTIPSVENESNGGANKTGHNVDYNNYN